MPTPAVPRRDPPAAKAAANATANAKFAAIQASMRDRQPITAPHHGWFTSPARSHADVQKGKELPLHLVALILSYLDNAGDLARVTRTSRLFHYMALPRLYENVTLRSYSEIRYVDGRPEGYGNGSPFAMGLNTLVSRNFTDYIQSFRVIGDWREHDIEDYSKGRVPDNSMMLQIALRAAMDKMKNLKAFAWELNTKPLGTIYQTLMTKPSITSLTLRCQTRRIPRPTTVIPPLPNLITLVVYDIDPLCYPDDISVLLLHAKKLENLKMHFSPRMRENGEESANLISYFGRCIAAKHQIKLKRVALYNLYARHAGDEFENCTDPRSLQEITIINCMGSSSDPMTVFLDDTWRIRGSHQVPMNLKMIRGDVIDKLHCHMLGQFYGLERMYLVSRRRGSKPCSSAATPTTPSMTTTGTPTTTNGASGHGTPTEVQCKGLASEYLAVIQSNHRTLRHLLLPDHWQLSDDALFKLCESCPDLEQVGFACSVPQLELLRRAFSFMPKVWALRMMIPPASELAEKMDSMDIEMHQFAIATEMWRPEYKNLQYVGLGQNYVFKLGGVVYPPKGRNMVPPGQENSFNAKRMGPMRRIERVSKEEVQHIEIWGLDSTEFEPKFP